MRPCHIVGKDANVTALVTSQIVSWYDWHNDNDNY